MKVSKKWLFLLLFVFLVIILTPYFFSSLNSYQRDGTINISGLSKPVKIFRDKKGMAYIYAQDFSDLWFAQGFITAQDRLFPMELTRLFATGRICELAGEKAKPIDIRMRTIGFYRNAMKHAKILTKEDRHFLQRYIDGVNTYINTRKDNYPLEFKLAGIQPGLWTIEDSLAIVYFMGWNSAANFNDEIIAQMLIEKIGLEKAQEIFPLNINPEDPHAIDDKIKNAVGKPAKLGLLANNKILSYPIENPLHIGSNNWVVGPKSSPNGMPILANDPHLETTILPGPWYPCGLITPESRAVGVNIPGIPGLVIGRTNYFSIGVTNGYGDTQDLYVETPDPNHPDHYLEGDKSIPFEVIEETIKIKDKKASQGFREERIKIRLTKRGPVISDVIQELKTDKILTMRWSMFETMTPSLGFATILTDKTVTDIKKSLGNITTLMLNFVFADTKGNIGWQTTGRLPIRSQGSGIIPYPVKTSEDNWSGWIPFDEMPQSYNPQKGWLGTCNHKTVNSDYPFYYSSHFSPSYRYRRLIELLDKPGVKTVDDHWSFQRDTMNMMARQIAPIMAKALMTHEDTKKMGEVIAKWDFMDDPDKAGPTVFQAVFREFALLTYQDELGPELSKTMLSNWYFWEERLNNMILAGASPWFDNGNTKDKTENMDDLFYQAALAAKEQLTAVYGENPEKWKWGKIHQMEFVSPIRREGFGKRLLGAGPFPAPGSQETLYRGYYKFTKPYTVFVPASLRMVADLGDNDKVLAVLSGGVSGRLFDKHIKDQVESYMNGDKMYWWFSDKAIKEHAQHSLILNPQ